MSSPLSLLRDPWLIDVINSSLSLPQTHPKYPRAALLHAMCAVASTFTPAVSNPSLRGTRGNTKHRPLGFPYCFLTTADEVFTTKRRAQTNFAEEQAKFAAEQIDLLTNLGESLLESIQGVKLSDLDASTVFDCPTKPWLF